MAHVFVAARSAEGMAIFVFFCFSCVFSRNFQKQDCKLWMATK